MRNKLHQIIINAVIFIVVFYVLDWLFALFGGTPRTLGHTAIRGFLTSLFFTFAVSWWARRQAAKIHPPTLSADEHIMVAAPANLAAKFNNVRGKLFLTGQRLIFKADNHSPTGQLNLLYRDIQAVNTAHLLPNKIQITGQDGTVYIFFSEARDALKQHIAAQLTSASDQSAITGQR